MSDLNEISKQNEELFNNLMESVGERKTEAPADFSPEFGGASYAPAISGYHDLQPFRFWCQKVIPLVYSDELSYYELLCKVVDYLNTTMDNVTMMGEDMGKMYTAFSALQNYTNVTFNKFLTAYNQLQKYVNDYFTNLDVQQEINKKLDNMVKDGTFSTLIYPVIANYSQPVWVDSVSNMTDKNRTYVLKSNGHMYYWNGTAWTDTGREYPGDLTASFTSFGSLQEGTDINTLTDNGYWILYPSSDYPNAPTASGRRLLLSFSNPTASAAGTKNQMFIDWTHNYFMSRTYHDGAWEPWHILNYGYEDESAHDLNQFTNTGWYSLGINTQYANTPNDTVGRRLVMVFNGSAEPGRPNLLYGYQLFINYTTKDFYIRYGTTNLWTEWVNLTPIAFFDEIPTTDSQNLDDLYASGWYLFSPSQVIENFDDKGDRRMLLIFSRARGSDKSLRMQVYLNWTKSQFYFREFHDTAWDLWHALGDFNYKDNKSNTIFDLNEMYENGWYSLYSSREYQNAPSNAPGHRLVITYNGTLRINTPTIVAGYQLYFNTTAEEFFIRFGTSSGWNDWVNLNEKFTPETLHYEVLKYSDYTSSTVSPNVGTPFRIMSYNVAHYNHDSEVYISPEQLNATKYVMSKVNPDIMVINEDSQYIDGSTVTANSKLFLPIWPISPWITGTTIRSKRAMTGTSQTLNAPSGRGMRVTKYRVGDYNLVMLGCHLSPKAGADGVAERLADLNFIAEKLADGTFGTYKWFVMAGDLNTETEEDLTNLTQWATANNMSLGNGGYFDWLCTWKNEALDNIIVNENVVINHFAVLAEYKDVLYSDHLPVYADLTLLD